MCVWVHPSRPEQSIVIASDKKSGFVFVYDLQGELLQSVSVPKPGNIDIRQGVKLGDQTLDLVVVNQRTDGFKLVPFRVNAQTCQIERIDAAPLLTGPNYGGCLSCDRAAGRAYFFCTSDAGTVEQHEFLPAAEGKVTSRKVRSIPLGKCEGAVADDEEGVVFIAEETGGIWKLPIHPDSAATPVLIAPLSAGGLQGDLEGLAIVKQGAGRDFLIVSDQGRHRFVALDLHAPHAKLAEFAIDGAEQTDGIEVVAANLGPAFPHGAFLCHTGVAPCPVLVTPWERIAELVQVGR
jgi:3-phytase